MYEGKNIHYSTVDQRPLCSFSGKICKQRRLNGYALCLRHILEDPSAPYKKCINLAKNGQQCSNVIPNSRQSDYCNSHVHAQTTAPSSLQASGLASQVYTNLPQPANGLDSNILTYAVSPSQPPLCTNLPQPFTVNGPEVQTPKKVQSRQNKSCTGMGSGLEDPYAFPSDPEPPRAAQPTVSYGNMTQPFPSLSQALANLAAGAKVGQPQVYKANRTDPGGSSMARLYPELADKLEIGKNKSPKGEPAKGKTVLSSPSNNKSSRTMNRLQTKIAQNKIKDKLKKSSISNTSNSPNSSLTNSNTSHTNENISNYSTDFEQVGSQDDKQVITKKHHISSSPTSSDPVVNHKPKAKNKTKSNSRSGSSNMSSQLDTPVRPVGHFPTLESHLQTNPLVNLNTWTAPGFPVPGAVLPQGEGQRAAFNSVAPAVTFLSPTSMTGSLQNNHGNHGDREAERKHPEDVVMGPVPPTVIPAAEDMAMGHVTPSVVSPPTDVIVGGFVGPSVIPPPTDLVVGRVTPSVLPPCEDVIVGHVPPSMMPPPLPEDVVVGRIPPPPVIPPHEDMVVGHGPRSVMPPPMCGNMDRMRSGFPFLPIPFVRPPVKGPVVPGLSTGHPAPICDIKQEQSVYIDKSTNMCSSNNITNAVTAPLTCVKPEPHSPILTQSSGEHKTPKCVKFRHYRGEHSLREACQRVKRHSSLKLFCYREKKKRHNINLIPMGVDSSDDNASDFEEPLPVQHEWLISSSESEEDEDLLDDPLLANIRHTKQNLLHAKLRRYFTQTQKSHSGNVCLNTSRHKDTTTLVQAARRDPTAAAEALKLILQVPDTYREGRCATELYTHRPCLCKDHKENNCNNVSLPFTNQCKKHIMYNVDEQLYDYCTAKFSDNTQCCIPVFDIRHELPLCPEHAAKAENYQKNLEASRPKKPRKKTKPSALTRPPKKGKKKKNQRKHNRNDKSNSMAVVEVTSSDEVSKQESDAPSCGNPHEPVLSETPPPCVSSPEESKDDLDPVEDDLGNDLEESFSPGTIDEHLELPLGEQDLNEVLNKLPEDAFDLFSGKNGEFVNSRVEEEAAAFEHVLAETSKKMKASEVLNTLTRESSRNMTMMMGEASHMVDNHVRMVEDGGHEDAITKEIADSILQQDLSPAASIVDDLGQDNISALASSLSAHDLRNISQVLNATLINPAATTDLSAGLYGSGTSVHHHPLQQQVSLQTRGQTPGGINSGQGQGHCPSSSGHQVQGHNRHGSSFPYVQTSGLMVPHGSSNTPPIHSQGQLINSSPIPDHCLTSQTSLGTSPTAQVQPLNGTSSSSQSIAQILAALTASTKQFTNVGSTGPHDNVTTPQYASVASLDNLLQVPLDTGVNNGTVVMAPSHSHMALPLPTSLENHIQSSPANSTVLPPSINSYMYSNNGPSLAQCTVGPTSHPQVVPKNLLAQSSLHNGLLTLPTNANQLALPMASGASHLGLKLACPLQTLVPVGLFSSSIAQGIPAGVTPVTGSVLTNHGQPLVAMTNSSAVVPIATGQAQGSTPGQA